MELIESIADMKDVVLALDADQSLGFIPTMGALHEGHLSLVEHSTRKCDLSVVSIYVNPAQFGPQEDLANYPRNLDRDLELLAKHKVDYVFFPDSEEMYPDGYRTWVDVTGLGDILCGASRPGHFRGVATIVLKLVHIIRPAYMFMGLKDYQQIVILETMLNDLNSETRIVRCPIVREKDGLALSSRNVYLNAKERLQALCLRHSIQKAQDMVRNGIKDAGKIIQAAQKIILAAEGRPDYIKLVDGNTLAEQKTVTGDSRLILAVHIGKTRLIDNDALVLA